MVGALKKDIVAVGGDYDSTLTFTENVGCYRECFEAARKAEVLHEKDQAKTYDQTSNMIQDVLDRETSEGFRPEDQFKLEPFSTISDLMTKHGINTKAMRHFLDWRSRQIGVEKRQKTKAGEEQLRRTKELLRRIKGGKQTPKFFDYEVKQEPPESP